MKYDCEEACESLGEIREIINCGWRSSTMGDLRDIIEPYLDWNTDGNCSSVKVFKEIIENIKMGYNPNLLEEIRMSLLKLDIEIGE